MKNCVEILDDVNFIDSVASPGICLERTDIFSAYNGYRLARVGIAIGDPTTNIVGIVNETGTGYISSGFHGRVKIEGGKTFDAGAALYLKNQGEGAPVTPEIPLYNGQTIWPIAIALESSDSPHYSGGYIKALVRIEEPRIQEDGEDA